MIHDRSEEYCPEILNSRWGSTRNMLARLLELKDHCSDRTKNETLFEDIELITQTLRFLVQLGTSQKSVSPETFEKIIHLSQPGFEI